MSNGGLRRFLWLLFFLLLPACGGGGGSTAVPHSTTSGASAPVATSNASGGNRVALRLLLGAKTSTKTAAKSRHAAVAKKALPDFTKFIGYAKAMQIKAAKLAKRAARMKKRRTATAIASASTRSPQYINENETDTINIYVNGGSVNTYDVSYGNTAQYLGTQLSSQPCQFLSDNGDNDTVRECTFDIPAAAGSDSFYVTASCASCGPDYSFADLSVGLTTATITAGAAQAISITLRPVVDTIASSVEIATPPPVGSDPAALDACPKANCWLYDLDAEGSGASPVGDLAIWLGDAGFVAIGATMPDPNPADIVNGVANTIPNIDPFVLLPASDPATSLSNDTISASSIVAVNDDTSGGHVFYGTDETCGTPATLSPTSWTTGSDFWNTVQPYVCYDNGAPFTGDNPQYYATISLSNALGIFSTAVVAPVFAPTPDQATCNTIGAGTICQEIGQYGLSYVTVDASSCLSTFRFTTDGNYTVLGGSQGGLYAFDLDGNGYSEIGIDYLGSNSGDSCTVNYSTDSSATFSRTYTASQIGITNGGGPGSGEITTILNHKKRVR